MKTVQFIRHLSPLPPTASESEMKAIEQFIEQYPWCGIARQLLLEAMQQNNSVHLNNYLPKAIVYVVHREQLYRRLQQLKTQATTQDEDILIIEEEPLTEPAPSEAKESPVTKEEPVTCNLSLVTQEEEPAAEPAPSEVKESLVTQEEERPKSKPVLISVSGDYFSGETIEVDVEIDPVARFIVERPQIRPIAGALIGIDLPNQIEQSPPPKKFEDIVSETLAKIYEDQGLVSLALNTYEKLSLLEPKKSAYFATRIQNLKFKLKS